MPVSEVVGCLHFGLKAGLRHNNMFVSALLGGHSTSSYSEIYTCLMVYLYTDVSIKP